jgi:hypothetical protein
MKILLSTILHNTPELGERMAFQWNADPFTQTNQCAQVILDNGSDRDKISPFTSHRSETNGFFGGGCNFIMDHFLKGDYEYLAIFNSDILYHPYKFLENCMEEIRGHNLDFFSPSVINGKIDQCKWRTVHNWGSKSVRKVRYIDDQCPIFSRRQVEKMYPYPPELYLGYGTDFYASLIANENNFNIGVSDNITVCHLENYTVQRDKMKEITKDQYYNENMQNMTFYFNKAGKTAEFEELFKYGESYKYE